MHCKDEENHINKAFKCCRIENIPKELSLKIHFGHQKKHLCIVLFLSLDKGIKIQSHLTKAHF